MLSAIQSNLGNPETEFSTSSRGDALRIAARTTSLTRADGVLEGALLRRDDERESVEIAVGVGVPVWPSGGLESIAAAGPKSVAGGCAVGLVRADPRLSQPCQRVPLPGFRDSSDKPIVALDFGRPR